MPFVIAGDSAGRASGRPVNDVNPVAQTAPVASPMAPKASQAASRRRDRLRGAGESNEAMASLPFVARSIPTKGDRCGHGNRQFAGFPEKDLSARRRRGPDATIRAVPMRRLIYSMSTSLDGYIKGPDGTFDWSVPSEEEHRLHNEHVRELSAHLLGRALYETMLFWYSEDASSSEDPVTREFAAIWRALPKVVFSRSLTSVEGANTRLATRDIEAELAELDGGVGVGGAALAAECARRGLIDEYLPFVKPFIVGGGTPFLPPLDAPVELRLLETRTFGDGAVYLRFARAV